jgi:predicted SAM-dependent methyltransferase
MVAREDSWCPWCRSLERHRLAYILLKPVLNGSGYRTLHVSPEPPIAPWLKRISKDYIGIDIDGTAMVQMDVTDLKLPDNSQNLVWCSHVLEHVPADRKAMSEMYRVLVPGGMAVIQIPIGGEKTYENPEVTTPQDRLKHFLQEDHVRLFGMDIVQRLEEAGFQVQVKRAEELDPAVVKKHALSFRTTNEVFVCTKPA